jgi:glutamate dehydrogenase/leucine dehydrogenase
MRVDTLLAQEALYKQDWPIAESIGLSPDFVRELDTVRHVPLGTIAIAGTDETVTADRFFVGPEDTIPGGGIKEKSYPDYTELLDDGVIHAWAMRNKAGALGRTESSGGKSIINVDPRLLSPSQRRDVMRAKARLMYGAGLTDPLRDKPAADEGTGPYIDDYVSMLEEMGVPHAFASITCKSNMTARGPATGGMASLVQRLFMDHEGRNQETSAVQGAGFAGLYYAAEAFAPGNEADRLYSTPLAAIGDMGPDRRPKTLLTDRPEGLPVLTEWVESLLLHPEVDRDLNHEKVQGNRLYALARKIERSGVEVQLKNADVLTLDPDRADCLVPAATSHVITAENIGAIGIKRLLIIANNIFANDTPDEALQGFELRPSEIVSAGGLCMSFEERDRDMDRIRTEASGGTYRPLSDAEYTWRARKNMTAATLRIIAAADKYAWPLPSATTAVSLGNYAIARDQTIDPGFAALLRSIR